MLTSVINNNLGKYVEQLITTLNLPLYCRGNIYQGTCAVHGGDNPMALCVYCKDGKYLWKCFTRDCQKEYGADLLGLIRGILSNVHGKKVGFPDTIKFANKFLDGKDLSLEVPKTPILEKNVEPRPIPINIPIEKYTGNLRSLEHPSSYFVRRGYSKEVLNRFNVSICINKESKYYTRSIVPFLDANSKNIIGFTARSFYTDSCSYCGMYHSPHKQCPHTDYAAIWGKWRTLKGFYIHEYLYGDWLLEPGKFIILVEGPGDVWRLHEAGYKNCVSLCGCTISDVQINKLKVINNKNLIVALDNDTAGRTGNNKVKYKLEQAGFKVELYYPPGKDWGACDLQSIKKNLGSVN